MTIHRKPTRLASKEYRGRRTYFVTICCDRRLTYLRTAGNAGAVLQTLLECAAHKSFVLHAYCLMPDHLHVLAQGLDNSADLLEFVRLFKQRSAFAFRRSPGKRLWEMGFYDYILRPSDHIEAVAAYIWWNPVRSGLCSQPKEFPFTGTQTIHWIDKPYLGPPWSAPWQLNQANVKERV